MPVRVHNLREYLLLEQFCNGRLSAHPGWLCCDAGQAQAVNPPAPTRR